MSLSKQEFTNVGRDMLGAAQAGATLNISKIVVGSGSAAVPADLWPLTALIHHELDVVISSKRYLGDGVMIVEGSFRSDEASAAFYLHELGIMAHTSAGSPTDQLYSVANVFSDPPDYIDPAAPTIQSFKIKLIVDRIDPSSIVVSIGPSEAIIGENVGDAPTGPGPYKEAAGNVLRFKRFVAGAGIELEEQPAPEDGADTIEIRSKQLRTNVDLYVPLSYPGITDPSVLFPTVQAAHDYLTQFHIPADKTATIHVYSGHFANTIPIVFTHPDAAQIQVIGLDLVARPVTGTITRAGTLPNIDVTITVPSGTAGIAVNDVVYLYDSPHVQFEGCGYVTQVISSTQLKIRMRIANVLPPASTPVTGATKLVIFPTQFTCNMNDQMFKCPNGIKLIKNFGMRSLVAQQGSAVNISGNLGGLENCAAVSFSLGYGVAASAVYLRPIVAANACDVGIEVGPSGNAFLKAPNPVGGWARFSYHGNVTYGLWVVGGSYVTLENGTATYCCSNGTGIRSDTRGFAGVSNSSAPDGGFIVGWNDQGCVTALMGVIMSANAVVCAIQVNVTWDLRSMQGGQISIVHNASLSGHYDPALGVLGPSGGYNAASL